MGYLDYAGLQYLWGKLKEKFATKSHSHDDRYYTESEMDGKLNSKVDNTETGANGLLSKLTTSWTATPTDNTYFIRQDTGGGNSFGRVKFSTIWSYIKGKADGVYQPKGSYAASGHTHDDRYYTEAEVNTKLGTKASSDHTHGLNSSSLAKTVDNVTTNSWDMVGGNKDFLLRSLRMQAKAPDWLEGSYAAGIAFGGSDTKGVISHAYNSPAIKFAGGNGSAPVWWLRLTGTSGKTYDLNAMPYASSAGATSKLSPFIKTTGEVKDSNSWFRVARFDLYTINTLYNNIANMWANWTQLRASFLIEGRYAKSGVVNVLAETTGNISVAGQANPKGYYAKNRISIKLNCYGVDPAYVEARAAISDDNHMYVDFWVRNGEYNTTSVYCLGQNSSAVSLITNFSVSTSITSPDYTYYDCMYSKTSYGDSIVTKDILPVSNNANSIGNSNNKWNTIYATTFNGKATTAGTADVANSVDWSKVQNKPSTFTPASHTHDDRYYTETEVNSKLDGKSNTGHTHDDRYYTETEINTKLNGKANSSHTHTKAQITDFPASLKNPTALTIQTNGTTAATYDGSAAKTVNVTKSNIGLGNVDNTADKNKSVASAAKLTTARTVSGGSDITLSFNYDGSGNSTANIGFYSCKHSIGNTNNYPFHRFAKLDNLTGAYTDKTMLVYITQDYSGGGFGICRLSLRTNNSSSTSSVEAKWLVRSGFSADFVQVAIYNVYGKTYADAFIKINGSYGSTTISALESGERATKRRTWTLVDSNEVDGTTATDKKTSSECWKTIAEAGTALHKQAYSSSASATDNGYVATAGSANTASIATTGVQDYNASNRIIKIGYAGTGLTKDNLTHVAGYTENGNKIKDVSKDVLQSWLGLGASAYKKVQSLSAVGHSDWQNQSTDDSFVPTMAFMAYWNGAFNGGGSSNLQYCDRGRFGTIVTKSIADFAPASGSNDYVRVYNSGTVSGTDNASINDLAKQHFAMAMVNNATDNPLGAKKWIHAINMAWNNGVNSSWVSQIALGVQDSYGMWFRTGQGAITGRAWNRVYDSSYHPNADHASAADSATNATNATTATKLSSNAGSSVQPVYFSGGKPVAIGYTISSSVPANAKFTDTTYGVASSSSNGLMSSTDKTKLDDFSRVINIQKQIKLTTDWQDTGIAGTSLDTGTYVVQVSGFNSSYTQLYSEIYSGVMSWYSGTTNSGNSSEIFLHNAGLADNNNAIYLRTLRVAGSKTLKLQIACKVAATGTDTLTFKFRRLI